MNLGQKLIKYRRENNLTQAELAKKLEITQVHVSRIEQGANPSPALSVKISSLLGEVVQKNIPTVKNYRDKNWSLSFFVLGGQKSGDRVLFYPKKFQEAMYLAHLDAEGHDKAAIKTGDFFRISFETCLSLGLNSFHLSPDVIATIVDRSIKEGREVWPASSSCSIFKVNRYDASVDLVNAGMPNVFKYVSSEKKVRVIGEKQKISPLGQLDSKRSIKAINFDLQVGDVLLSFSDGFLEVYQGREGNIPIEDYLSSISRSLRGDAEGIGMRIAKDLNTMFSQIQLRDDLSFLVLSRSN